MTLYAKLSPCKFDDSCKIKNRAKVSTRVKLIPCKTDNLCKSDHLCKGEPSCQKDIQLYGYKAVIILYYFFSLFCFKDNLLH